MKPIRKLKVNQTVPKIPVGGIKKVPTPVIPPTQPIQAPIVRVQPPPATSSPQAMKPIPKIAPKKEEIVPDATSTQLIALTNTYRTAQKLPNLVLNPKLSKSAQERANYIAQHLDQWNHQGTDNSTTTDDFAQTIIRNGYRGRIGENLAKDFRDIQSAFQAWQKSKTHNDNLIRSEYQDIGIGYATYLDKNGNPKTIFVQHFGRPKQ